MTPAAESTRDQGGLRQPWSNLPWFTLLLAGAAVLIYLVAGPAPAGLLFDRAALANGEVWRLLTGHLVHSDPAHLAWNLAEKVATSMRHSILPESPKRRCPRTRL